MNVQMSDYLMVDFSSVSFFEQQIKIAIDNCNCNDTANGTTTSIIG